VTQSRGMSETLPAFQRLTEGEVQAAWEDHFEKHDVDSRNRLMEHYLYELKFMCEHLHSRLPRQVPLQDVLSFGIEGLRLAIGSYDPVREVKFETYLRCRVRGAVLDGLRSNDWVPRLVRRQAAHLERNTEHLTARLGRRPADDELAEHMGLSDVDLLQRQCDTLPVRMSSLDQPLRCEAGSSSPSCHDVVPEAKTPEVCARLQREDLKRMLLKGLKATERRVLLLYYFEEMTMREIGAVLGMSESRVSQVHGALVTRLQESLAHCRDEFVD
jgi:RNA polymerase sigma factor FliA